MLLHLSGRSQDDCDLVVLKKVLILDVLLSLRFEDQEEDLTKQFQQRSVVESISADVEDVLVQGPQDAFVGGASSSVVVFEVLVDSC